jgi:hypothetical protein
MKKTSNHKFRSGLEVSIGEYFDNHKIPFEYETLKIDYFKPQQKSYYRPDFILKNGIIVEAKGLFTSADRKKHKTIRNQHGSKYDIRFVFSNSLNRIGKKSKTTYAKWCEHFDFKFHCIRSTKILIPLEWVKEKSNAKK